MKFSHLWTAPNQLTLLRMLFLPFIVISLVDDPAFSSSLTKLFVTPSEAFLTGVVLLIVGALVGALGSAFAVRRFLVV